MLCEFFFSLYTSIFLCKYTYKCFLSTENLFLDTSQWPADKHKYEM